MMGGVASIVVLWILAAAATVWILGPVVMYVAGRRRLWAEVNAAPAAAEPRAGDPDYERRYHELVALGFRPIGATHEHARFLTPLHWSWREVEPTRWLASPDDRTFFFMDRGLRGEPVRLGTATFFEGGGALYVRSPGVGLPRTEAGNYLRVETHGRDPKELLSLHAEEVAAFSRARGLAVRGATLHALSAEMMTAQTLMMEQRKDGNAALAMPLAMFGVPLLNLVFVLKRGGPKAMFIAPLLVCFAAVFYAIMGRGLVELTRRQRLRDSHAVDLNAKAAASDGTIVDTGKYERWVRALAGLGAAYTAICGVLLVTRIPAMNKTPLSFIMLALFLFTIWRAMRALTARARGRADRPRKDGDWDRSQAWSSWFSIAALSMVVGGAMGIPELFPVVRRSDTLFFAVILLPALGWWLDKQGRRKSG